MELNKSIFKGLLITNLITLFLLFGTNIAWFVYESQFETVQENEEYSQSVQDIQNVQTITQTQTR